VSRAVRALRNAFFSPGRRLFGLRFSRDYLRFAWRAARHWGSTGSGSIDFVGHRLEYPNQSHALFLVHEIFVNGAYAFDASGPRPRIVDCGANIGVSVLFFKTLQPDADVMAFEPDPATFARLERTIALNALQDVRAENAAVGEQDGTASFYYSPSDSGSLTASVQPSWGGDKCREVRVVRLSRWIRQPIDFLKLDVEGAEYGVVRDLIATDAIRWVREAVIEYHDLAAEPDAVRRMIDGLRNAGFEVVVTANSQQTGLIRARRGV
jgi:FkbM family methyltransferase